MSRRAPASGAGKAASAFKIVLLGESAVGKSSIVLRFVRNDFDDYRESTIGAAFLSQTVTLENERVIKFEGCFLAHYRTLTEHRSHYAGDTAGQERYKSLAPMYYRSARVAIVAYDITSAPSLDKAKSWIKELQRQADPQIVIALVGNKADLDDQREVSHETAETYAKEENAYFFETSAKTGEGVNDMFLALAQKLATMEPPPAKQQGVKLETKQPSLTDSCAC